MPITPHEKRRNALRVDRFLIRTFRRFNTNHGFLLAGALAYYLLLSLIPLVTLLAVILSKFLPERLLLATGAHYLRMLLPGESASLRTQIRVFLAKRTTIGYVLIADMLFFSSLAFSVLEKAMTVIFHGNVKLRRRHFLVSVLLPYVYISLLGVGLLVVTLVTGTIQAIVQTKVALFGYSLSLYPELLHTFGFLGAALMLSSIYFAMPLNRISLRHALLGGIAAAVLWEITRSVLVWYFTHLSPVNVVYGSLATVIIGLLTLEAASIIVLFGAQVIAEYEQTMAALQ